MTALAKVPSRAPAHVLRSSNLHAGRIATGLHPGNLRVEASGRDRLHRFPWDLGFIVSPAAYLRK